MQNNPSFEFNKLTKQKKKRPKYSYYTTLGTLNSVLPPYIRINLTINSSLSTPTFGRLGHDNERQS